MTTAPNGTITDYPFPGYEVENPAGSPTVRITFSIAGQVVALKVMGSSTATYYLYNDRLGSTATMSTTGGGPVTGSTARYYPFGDWRTEPTAAETSRWYTGHVHDNLSHNDLGLIYMNACFYLPGVGRFVSADTIVPDAANPQSHNRYTYVLNQPLRLVDPTGHYYYDPACDCMVHTSNPGNEYPANLARGHGMAGFGSLKGGAIIPIEVAGGWTDQEFDAIMTGVGILCEPCDWAYAASDGFQWYDAVGLLPFIPATIGDNLGRFVGSLGDDITETVSDIFFRNYNVGSAFSGVFDPNTSHFIVRPSGSTLLQDGTVPTNLVRQRGGHGDINEQLAQHGIDPSKTVGFTVFYDGLRQLSVAWNSGSVNSLNHGSYAAPVEYRQAIMDALQQSTGYTVISR